MHTKVPSSQVHHSAQGQKRGPERPQSPRCEAEFLSSHCDPVVAPGWHRAGKSGLRQVAVRVHCTLTSPSK